MGYIYISYSRQNAETARRLVHDLQQRGYTLWIDTEDLTPGIRWSDQIDSAIREAEVFITLLSPAAQNRTIQNEIELAYAADKPIIPVLVEATTIPATLANHQIVNATGDWDAFIQRLVNAIDASTASLQIRRTEPTSPIAAPDAARPMSQAQRTRPNRTLIAIGILSTIAVIILVMVATLSSTLNDVANDQPTRSDPFELTSTAIAQINTIVSTNLSATPTLSPSPSPLPSETAAVTIMRTSNPDTPAFHPTIAVEAVALTATAIARTVQPTISAQNTDTPSPTTMPGIGAGEVSTAVALQVEATVAAAIATENSQLSPAEAAQIRNVTSGNDTPIFLTSVLAALALGIAVTGLLLNLTRDASSRPRSRQPVHHNGTPGQPQSVLPKMLLEDYQIFTSSSDKDREWVRILVEDLEALGYAVWWYAKDAPGLPFGNEIRSAIYHTKVFMIVLSPDSMQSKHIEEEIRWAEIYDRPIVPVECRATSIEERFYGLAKGADIDFTVEINYKEALEYLTQAIDRHLRQRLEQLNIEDTHDSP